MMSDRKRRPIVDGQKECSRCFTTKPVSEFQVYLSGPQKGIVYSRCRVCMRERNKEYDKNKRRASVLKSLYGITPDEYDSLERSQSGKCAICNRAVDANATASRGRKRTRLDIDHCHNTNRIRGLLCRRCNTGIGQFLHDPYLLRKAADYLVI